MKNGISYDWNYKDEKWIWVKSGFLSENVEFKTFKELFGALEKACRISSCK
jgi:hypothetical protein